MIVFIHKRLQKDRLRMCTGACYAANPEIPVMFSAKRTFVLMGLFYTGLLPFVPM
jgi:hypothetical protein